MVLAKKVVCGGWGKGDCMKWLCNDGSGRKDWLKLLVVLVVVKMVVMKMVVVKMVVMKMVVVKMVVVKMVVVKMVVVRCIGMVIV